MLAYEGFAAGVTGDDAVRNVWRELGREEELKARPILSPSLYKSTAGVSEGMAMQLVGHASKSIHEVYLRPNDDQLRSAAGRMEGL